MVLQRPTHSASAHYAALVEETSRLFDPLLTEVTLRELQEIINEDTRGGVDETNQEKGYMKDGVRSETFYAAYASGEEPEDDHWVLDFGEWASVYRTWLARQSAYRDLVQRIQQSGTSLTGLIRIAG